MANWTIEERDRFGTRDKSFLVLILPFGEKTNVGRLSSGTSMGIDLTVIIMDGR